MTKREKKSPYVVRGHQLMCAVCTRGGCAKPPPGNAVIQPLLDALWADAFLPLQITGDVDLTCAHYLDVYAGRKGRRLPTGFRKQQQDHVWRRKDVEVLRVLGLSPGGIMPAYWVYQTLFNRQKTLDGICRTGSLSSDAWPECPFARSGYYEKIAAEGMVGSLKTQNELGETMAGRGVWAMIKPRKRADMRAAKKASVEAIRSATRLYIRPNHVLCILCTAQATEPLQEDNLVELRRRMEAEPGIPVVLTEGCCMVCDPCNVYDPDRNLCYHGHIKDTLRDLMILELLGLPPGAELPARDLYDQVYARIGTLKEICGWRDGSDTAPCWRPCSYESPALNEARAARRIAGPARTTNR